MQDDRERLAAVFDDLEARGYETHQRFWCCQTCGCANLAPDTVKYVFWHQQDDEHAFAEDPTGGRYSRDWQTVPEYDEDGEETGYDVMAEEDEDEWQRHRELLQTLYLAWGGDGTEIVALLRAHGFDARWPGTNNERIMIYPQKAEISWKQ